MLVEVGQRPVKMVSGRVVRRQLLPLKRAMVEMMTVMVKSTKAVVVAPVLRARVAATSVSVAPVHKPVLGDSGRQHVPVKQLLPQSFVMAKTMTVMA